MTSDFGVENKVLYLQNGVCKLGGESTRFLLSRKLLKQFQINFLLHC